MIESEELPKGWVSAEFVDFAELVNGRAYKRPEMLDEGTPLLRIQNLNGGDNWFYSDMELAENKYCEPGDLLYAWSATFGPYIYDGPRAIYHYHIWKVLPRAEMSNRFGFHLLGRISDAVRNEAHGVAMPHMTKGGMEAWPIALAPLNEQRRIVAKIDALQARSRRAREALDAIPALLDRFRQSVLAAAFRGDLTADWRAAHPDVEPASVLLERIRAERKVRWIAAEAEKARARAQTSAEKKGKPWGPEDDATALASGKAKAVKKYAEPEPVDAVAEGLPELPEGWSWATVEEVSALKDRAIQSGPFGSALKHSEFSETGVLVVGIDNVQDGFFSMGRENRIPEAKYDELKKFRARPGDVLITVMATVGRCAVIPDDLETAIITKHVYRISVERGLYEPDLLMNALRGAPSVLTQIGAGVRGQTRAGINGGVLKKLRLPVPPLGEQRRMLERVRQLLSSADGFGTAVSDATARVETLNQAILAKAFRGELVPQDPEDEPAAVLLERIRAEREAAVPKKKTRRSKGRR